MVKRAREVEEQLGYSHKVWYDALRGENAIQTIWAVYNP